MRKQKGKAKKHGALKKKSCLSSLVKTWDAALFAMSDNLCSVPLMSDRVSLSHACAHTLRDTRVRKDGVRRERKDPRWGQV